MDAVISACAGAIRAELRMTGSYTPNIVKNAIRRLNDRAGRIKSWRAFFLCFCPGVRRFSEDAGAEDDFCAIFLTDDFLDHGPQQVSFDVSFHCGNLYRGTRNWRPFVIFRPPESPIKYEDAVDVSGDGWKDIVLGGWGNRDGYQDVLSVSQAGRKNQIAWFGNPGHTGGNPITDHWKVHIMNANPGTLEGANKDMDEMAFAIGDINRDGQPDIMAASYYGGQYRRGT